MSCKRTSSTSWAEALASANTASNWLTDHADKKSEFIPFSPNFHSGELYTSFAIEELGNPTGSPKKLLNNSQTFLWSRTCSKALGLGSAMPASTPGETTTPAHALARER